MLAACETPHATQEKLDHIQRSGVCWCGGTVWENRPAIPISVCSWAPTADDSDARVKVFMRAREEAFP